MALFKLILISLVFSMSSAWAFTLTQKIDQPDLEPDFIHRFFVIPDLKFSFKTFGQAQESALNPDSIKVMVWNIYKAKKENFTRDFYQYVEGRDIVLLQEAISSEMKIFLDLPVYQWDFGISFAYRSDLKKFTGTMIGSSIKPRLAWMTRTLDIEPVVKTPKALTMATYPIAGTDQELMVVNIHGLNLTSQKPFERHLQLAIRQMRGHTGPIVFAGDFNTRTQGRMDYMIWLLVLQNDFKEMKFRNDERMRAFGTDHIIDFVFTRGLEIVDSEVLGELDSSDHKAMMFEARYQNQTP